MPEYPVQRYRGRKRDEYLHNRDEDQVDVQADKERDEQGIHKIEYPENAIPQFMAGEDAVRIIDVFLRFTAQLDPMLKKNEPRDQQVKYRNGGDFLVGKKVPDIHMRVGNEKLYFLSGHRLAHGLIHDPLGIGPGNIIQFFCLGLHQVLVIHIQR